MGVGLELGLGLVRSMVARSACSCEHSARGALGSYTCGGRGRVRVRARVRVRGRARGRGRVRVRVGVGLGLGVASTPAGAAWRGAPGRRRRAPRRSPPPN
eukprot:scaffold81450_cov28-Phaeocystis_antarctica.AAC.1